MSDLRESIGGFLGSSTIQVRDSSPSGQNDDTVEAILVPEGEVAFSQEVLEEDGVAMQNVQLVGDDLVLMDGGMIVTEEAGEMLVQDEMYVDAEQMDGQSEQVIAYVPESVPDQGQSLVTEETEVGIRRMEDSIQAEEGIYETNAAVRAEVGPRLEDQRIEEVPTTAQQHPEESRADLVGFDVHRGEVEDADGATYVEVESDRILLQEVPEQTVAELPNNATEQMEVDTDVPSQEEQPSLESGEQQTPEAPLPQETNAVGDSGLEREAAPDAASQSRFQIIQPRAEPTLYIEGSADSQRDRAAGDSGARDQELQVVPDSSATVPSKTFLNENLHESMDGSGERISPAAASMGMQMVPSSSENSRDTMVLHREEALLQDTIYVPSDDVPTEEDRLGELDEPEAVEDMGGVLVWQQGEDGQRVEVSESLTETEISQQLDGNGGEVEEALEENLMQALDDEAEQSIEGTGADQMTAIPDDEQITLAEATPEVEAQDVTHIFEVAEEPLELETIQEEAPEGEEVAEQGYEMCITLPGQHGEAVANFSGETGGRTFTVPINIGGRVQEIPIQIPDWADLTQQNLVAVTEDGTQIPLTFVQEGEEVPEEGQDGGEEEHIEVHMDSEMMAASQQCVPLNENELIAIQDSESGMILAQDGDNQYEVINMMDQHEYEIHDGVFRLVQSGNSGSGQTFRRLDVDNDISPATSVTPFFFDGSGMAVQEHSILPDTPEELANVIQIPEDAYLSGQPIELQMVEVPGGRVIQKAVGKGGTTRGAMTPRGAQRKRRPYQRHTPRQPRRSQLAVAAAESQTAVRSIGQPKIAPEATPPNEQRYIAVQEERPTATEDAAQVELSNKSPSVISPENMQALVQFLQSLPNNARGQTIQIVLHPNSSAADEDSARANTSEEAASKEQQMEVVRMPQGQASSKSTSDMAVQVTPNFLEGGEEMATDPGGGGTSAEDSFPLQKTTTITVMAEDIVPQSCINMLVEEENFLFGSKTPRKQKATAVKKKAAPKKIVTVEEVQYMIDPKPGVSYYAVVDYMSEHDQDGFSSASEMKRPEAQYSGFMEDHLELQSTGEQTTGRSVLESTVDSSVTTTPYQYQRRKYGRVSPAAAVSQPKDGGTTIDLPPETDQSSVTLTERTYEQAMLEEDLVSSQPAPQHPRKQRRSRMRASRPVIERYEHRCGYCEFGSTDKILVVEHCISEHAEQPVKTLSLLPQTSGRMCPYCLQTFDHMEFFAHMRFAHNEVHPFKCGYCEFMGRDRNQVRHHIQKKHRLPMKVINLLDSNRRPEDADSRYSGTGGGGSSGKKRIMAYSEGEETVYEYLTDEEELQDNDSDNANVKRDLVCPECKRAFKTLKYLKTHIKIHQPLRYQCSYCDFVSVMLHQVIRHCQKKHVGMSPKVLTKELDPDKYAVVSRDMDSIIDKVFALNTRLPRDPDAAKWMRKWFCPHCDYACQFGASYRRHLRMHANMLPYKCNYCSFKGREKYYVRRHINRMHKDLPMIVVENNPENCARDTSSDEDYQEKGLRRRRRRRTKDAEHAVVPLGHLEDELLGPHFQKLPVGERGTRGNRLAIDELENEFPLENVMRLGGEDGGGYRSRAASMQRLPSRSKLWSEENLDDYIKEQVGDVIVCKICGERVHEKVFHKHARKHFKLRPLKCSYCNYMSIEMSKIRAHNNLKHPGAPLKLEECHMASSITPEDFMDLLGGEDAAAVAGDAEENDPLTAHFECPFCQDTLAYTERCLRDHFYMHYDYYPYKCSDCGFQATTENKVVEHGTSHAAAIIVYQLEMDKPNGLEETIQQFLKEGEQIAAQRVNELLEQSAIPVAAGDDRDGLEGEASAGLTVSIFQCPVCDQQMTLHEVMVRRHLYEHYGYKPFKCGYCSFRGVSKGSIKQHSSIHNPAKPKIGLTEDAMPEDLAKILRHIRSVMKLSPEKMESAVIPNDETVRLASVDEDPLTAEGKRWKEVLASGQCPWCDVRVAGDRSKLHAHLLGHFNARPFQCSLCDERFSKRREAGQHAAKSHQGEEPKVIEVVDDEAEMRKGLLQFMKSKRSTVGAHKLMKNTSADEEKADGQEMMTTTTIEDEMKKLMGEGKEFQYQVVILNEDGTVVETMEVMAQQPVEEPGLEIPEARDVSTPPVGEDDGNADVAGETAMEADRAADVEEGAEKTNAAEVEESQNQKTGDETTECSAGEVACEPETGGATAAAEAIVDDGTKTADVGGGDAAPQVVEVEKDKDATTKVQDEQEEEEEQEEFNSEIVTVDRVLLTRSFRSETEDSGDDDNPMGSIASPVSSHNGSVNSDEEDDDDEMLAIGPSLEFVGDIISLLKNSSVALQEEKPAKVYKFMCQHCGVTFPKSATLQKHIALEHGCDEEVEEECPPPEPVAPETSSAALELQDEQSRGTKRGAASEDVDTQREEKRAKLDDEQISTAQEPPARGQKRGAPRGDVSPPDKRTKMAPEASDSIAEVGEAVLSPKGGEVTVDEVPPPQMDFGGAEDDEETIENITKMVLEGDGRVPEAADVAAEKDATEDSATAEELEESPSAHKSAPSRLEASKRENLKRMLEQEDLVPASACSVVTEESAPPAAEVSPGPKEAKSIPLPAPTPIASASISTTTTAISKPSRLEAYKLEALKRARFAAARAAGVAVDAMDAKQSSTAGAAQKQAEEDKSSPSKQTRKSSRVGRLPKRTRRLQESAVVQVGKYKLRGKARKDETSPKKSKVGRPPGKSSTMKMSASTAAKARSLAATAKTRSLAAAEKKTGASTTAKAARSSATTKISTAKSSTTVMAEEPEASTSQQQQSPVGDDEETEAGEEDVKTNPEEGLEALDNLEECDENLPKLLQILQLRPTREQEKS